MKKIITIITILMLLPIKVNALSGSISMNCSPSEVEPGKTVTCAVKGTTDETIYSTDDFIISVGSGASIQNFTVASGWEGNAEDNNKIQLFGNTANGTFDIGILNVKINDNAPSGKIKITIGDGTFNDANDKGHKITGTSTEITVVSGSTEQVTKGLSSLSVTNGVLSPTFSTDKTGYMAVIESNTFSINATPANSSAQITYTTEEGGTEKEISPTDITFYSPNDSGMMSIKINVGSGENAVQYTLLIEKKVSNTGSATLSSLTIGGKNVNLSAGTFEYTVTLDDVSSYLVQATLSDSANFEFDEFLVPPVTMSGENEFVLKINPKDKSSGASSETYTIKVKKTSSSSGNNVGTGSSNKDDVPSNPQTSDVPAMLMALVLMFSLIASITLYKKNLKGYN